MRPQEFEVSSINRAKIPTTKNHPTNSRVIFIFGYFSSVYGRNFKFLCIVVVFAGNVAEEIRQPLFTLP